MALPAANYDITIGGNGFFYGINDETPHVRQTSDFKRQQIDTSPEAGEQTLSQYWVRSQDSWHRGAGLINYDPGSNKETEYRFEDCDGINPWQTGAICPDQAFVRLTTGTGTNYVSMSLYQGSPQYWVVNNLGLSNYNISGTFGGTYTHPTIPLTEPVIVGSKIIVGATSTILSGDVAVTGALTALWSSGPASTTVTPYWVKNRIIATAGDKMWELTLAGGTIPATPTFAPPTTGGAWAAVSEAPDCILAAYNVAGQGFIYAILLLESTTAGGTPTIGNVVQVAQLPPGEEIYAMKSYLGSFVALGTTNGVRVCDLGQGGQITLGPLTVATTSPCRALGASKNFILAGITKDFKATVATIDLSQEILQYSSNSGFGTRTMRYAYAYGASVNSTGAVTSVWDDGDSPGWTRPVVFSAMAVTGAGVYWQTNLTSNSIGSFTTGKIRFDTNEPKAFLFLRIQGIIPGGSNGENIVIQMLSDTNPSYVTIATLTSTTNLRVDIPLNVAPYTSACQWIQLNFIMTGEANGHGVRIDFMQIKALPAPKPQRLIQYPLRLADFEQDRQGLEVGSDGSAWTRLQALEASEAAGMPVTIVDNTNGETYSAQIQKVQFIRDTPPSRNNKNFGGKVMLTVLKL